MNSGENKMKKWEGYKVTVLEYEYEDKKDSWDTIGHRDEYICPECQYLGELCPRCGGAE